MMSGKRTPTKPQRARRGRNRRLLLLSLSGIAVATAATLWFGFSESSEKSDVVVYKTLTCNCCNKWVSHLQDNGVQVSVVNVRSTHSIRERLGIPDELHSCHTATVGDYWVEGHVPSDLVQKLLIEQPSGLRGLTVPGMPIGSPGMEGPNPVRYNVLGYDEDGTVEVYASRQGHSEPG